MTATDIILTSKWRLDDFFVRPTPLIPVINEKTLKYRVFHNYSMSESARQTYEPFSVTYLVSGKLSSNKDENQSILLNQALCKTLSYRRLDHFPWMKMECLHIKCCSIKINFMYLPHRLVSEGFYNVLQKKVIQ